MAMAGSGMIPAIAISIGRIGNFNHTGRFYSVAANRITAFYSLPPNKKYLFQERKPVRHPGEAPNGQKWQR